MKKINFLNIFSIKQENDFIKLKEIINFIETHYNAISFIDILLNHTSFDSPWLLSSEDSYYSKRINKKLCH